MKRKFALLLALLGGLALAGCYQAHSDDDLRAVPVTNNPHLLPSSAHTAQGPGIGN